MSNIQTFLQNILSARYGKDVRQSIHDAIEEIDSVASTAKDSAVNSAESARKSAESASNNAGQAEQFRNEAEQFRNEAEGFVPENYTELVHTVEENAIKIDTIIEKAELNIKNTASGKDIRLTDSADGKVIELALYGKSKQDATTGKSLTANIMRNTTSNGIMFTLNEDGSVSMKGESTDNISLSVFSFTSNFTGMVKLSGCSGSNYWLYAWDNSRGKRPFTDETKTTLQTNNQYAPNKELSFYVEEGVNYSVFFRGFPGYKYENEVMFPMLSIEGGEYEPYTGGLPSPSPEYPQEIEVSGESGSVVVKSCGKNLLKNMLANMSVSGVNLTVNEDKSISIVGTNNHTGIIAARINESFFLEKGTYIANGSIGGNGSNYRWNIYKKDGTLLLQQGDGDAILELTEKTELYAQIIITKGATVNTRIYPMIRFASYTDGTYEPYKETTTTIQTPNGHVGIPAENGGNYTDETGQQWVCDEIVKYADGTGEMIQRIKKIVYDGVNLAFNDFQTYGDYKGFFVQGKTNDMKKNLSLEKKPRVISTHFKTITVNNSIWGGINCRNSLCVPSDKNYIHFIFDENMNTVEAANAWLKENPVTVYYELAEPSRTPLATEEIAEFEKLHTFYSVTNITNDSECGMKVTYLADLKKYTDNQLALQAQAQEAAMLNMLLLLPEETQAAMIEKDTNNLLMESEE